MKRQWKSWILVFVLTATGTGCNGGGGAASAAEAGTDSVVQVNQAPAKADVLIYDGAAAAYDGAATLAQIVGDRGLTYDIVGSAQLNDMALDDLAGYRAIVWPGGYATQMSDSLTAATRERIRLAVTERGVGFSGYCAGAFIAVGPRPAAGQEQGWGFSIIEGPELGYFHLEDEGIESQMVNISLPGNTQKQLLWWGGPVVPEVAGGVIGRYDDGKPAIVQIQAGKGFVTLSGPHPEAPQIWRDNLGLSDADGLDHELAWNLIRAAVEKTPLQSL